MALKYVSIGSLGLFHIYDDTEFTYAIETDGVIYGSSFIGGGGGGGGMLGPPNLTVVVDLSLAAWKTVATHEVATITGAVGVTTAVRCTTGVEGIDNIRYGSAGNTALFIGATIRNTISINQFWLTTTGSTARAPALIMGIDATSHLKSATLESEDIGYQLYTSDGTLGVLEFYFWWYAISSGATLVAGDGSAL